jgi:hypothetical protein
MDWHTEKFRQPIAAMESPMTGNWGGHSFEGDSCASASVRQVMGQLRSQRKPTSDLRLGWSTLRWASA